LFTTSNAKYYKRLFALTFLPILAIGGVYFVYNLTSVKGVEQISELELEYDEDERIIIISDTHLGCENDLNKYDYLENIISEADKIVINGDFFDNYECGFDDFMNSDYRNLFPLLLEKDTVYIYGNHNLKRFSDADVLNFSKYQTDRFFLTIGEKRYVIEHGHLITPSLEQEYPYLFANRAAIKFGRMIDSVGTFIENEDYFERYKGQNEDLKNWAKTNLMENEYLITGHTHLAEIDFDNHFINTGLIRYGYANYLQIFNGEETLVSEEY